jgi:hypothetical protein
MAVTFSFLEGTWAVVRLPPGAPLPSWAIDAPGFLSLTRTDDELSVICLERAVPAGSHAERGWSVLKLHGPFPLTEVGILASLAAPLAAAGVSVLPVGTFDTDYLLVRSSAAPSACRALLAAGHRLAGPQPI